MFNRNEFTKRDGSEWRSYAGLLECPEAGVRLFIRDRNVRKVEAELPTIRFGHSGRLIQSSRDYNLAWQRIDAVIHEACRPIRGYSTVPTKHGDSSVHFTRIDLVWQFHDDFNVICEVLKHARHPRVRRPTRPFENGGLFFPGTKFQVEVYDKARKMKIKNHKPVLRIEVRFKGKDAVAHAFGASSADKISAIDFGEVYAAYREEMLKFDRTEGVRFPTGKTTADFLAAMEMNHPGSDALSSYLRTRQLTDRSSMAMRKRVASIMKTARRISFATLLPEGSPPDANEIYVPELESRNRDLASQFDWPTPPWVPQSVMGLHKSGEREE